MALFQRSDTRPVDPVLAGLVLGNMPKNSGLVARQVPQINVTGTGSKGTIFTMGGGSFLGAGAIGSLKRVPGAEMQPVTAEGLGTVTYEVRSRSCQIGPLPVEVMEENLSPVALDRYFASVAAAALSIDEEYDLSQLLHGTGIWTASTTVAGITGGAGVKWNAAGADPIGDIEAMLQTFRTQTLGGKPRDAVIGYPLAQTLRTHVDFKKLASGMTLSNTDGNLPMTFGMLKAVFAAQWGINLIIGDAMYRTNNPAVTNVPAEIWNDAIWIGNLTGEAEDLGGMGVGVSDSALAIIRRSDISIEDDYVKGRKSWFMYVDMRSIEKVLNVNQGILAYDGN